MIQSTRRPLRSEFRRLSAYWSSGKTHRQPYVMPTPRRSGSTSARRRADEQTTSARCRSDVNYCRCGGRRTDVGLTSVCLLGLDLSEFCAGDAAVEAVSYTSAAVCYWRPAFRSDSFVCVHFVAVFYLQLFYSLTAALFIVYYALLCGFLEFQFTTLLYLSTRLELAAAQCFVPIHSFCLSVRPSVCYWTCQHDILQTNELSLM